MRKKPGRHKSRAIGGLLSDTKLSVWHSEQNYEMYFRLEVECIVWFGLVGLTLLNGSGFESGFLGFQKVSMDILRSKFSNNAIGVSFAQLIGYSLKQSVDSFFVSELWENARKLFDELLKTSIE